jgi:hypothetical protein
MKIKKAKIPLGVLLYYQTILLGRRIINPLNKEFSEYQMPNGQVRRIYEN